MLLPGSTQVAARGQARKKTATSQPRWGRQRAAAAARLAAAQQEQPLLPPGGCDWLQCCEWLQQCWQVLTAGCCCRGKGVYLRSAAVGGVVTTGIASPPAVTSTDWGLLSMGAWDAVAALRLTWCCQSGAYNRVA
jgi:hypothetical protein